MAPAIKPPADAGARDPADFPRPPGLMRLSYGQDPGKLRDAETATYHSKDEMDSVAAACLDRLQAAGWKKGSDQPSGSGLSRLRIVDWTKPAKEAEIRFYAARSGGTDLWVRFFTYKTVAPPAAASAVPGNATLAQATAVNAAGKSAAMGAAPLGPPPTNIHIDTNVGDAAGYYLNWESSEEFVKAEAYVSTPSGWFALPDNGLNPYTYDNAFMPPNTDYKVVLHYPGGREGSAVYTWANPPQPGVVTAITAQQAGPGKIHVTWKMPPGTQAARLFVSGLDPAGQLVHGSSVDLSNVPAGTHTVRVVSCYMGRNRAEILGPADAPATVTVQALGSNLRIVLLGVQCVHETFDDPLQLDGKHDEIFAGVYVTTVPPLPPTSTAMPSNRNPHQDQGGPRGWHKSARHYMDPAPGTYIRTKVMGDTNGFSDRVRAGTASDKGGIQTGDFVPSNAITSPQPGVAVTSDRFPLLLWQGSLNVADGAVVIAPALFEWDNADDTAWNVWSSWWTSTDGKPDLGLAVAEGKDEAAARNLSVTHEMPQTDDGDWPPPEYDAMALSGNGTRLIGIENQISPFNPNDPPHLVLIPRGFAFTRKNIDALLGNNAAAVVPLDVVDGGSKQSPALGGHYILYLQIERVAATTAARP